ncbi:MAG: hypothetical protein J0H64_02165 [Actinobacteria bacterium]|nr:hypothetical protein [Actinomycetota bacterium]
MQQTQTLKDHRWSNLRDPNARTGRGYAYTYLCAVMAVVAENIRRIVTGVTQVLEDPGKPSSPKQRARRRRDSLGQRLPRRTGYAASRAARERTLDPAEE